MFIGGDVATACKIMEEFMLPKLSQEKEDVVREIVTIGAGNAATALSQMLKKKVSILVPKVNSCRIEEASKIFGDTTSLVTSVYLRVLGDVSGVMLFSFKKDDANRFADILLGNPPGKTKVLNEMATSALKETGTILSGSYLSALAKLIKVRALLSAPGLAQDMAGAIVDAILAEISTKADYAIVINTELAIVDEKVMAYFFFIPDVDSIEMIMQSIGVDL
jgi:chemotaxis protein CheC